MKTVVMEKLDDLDIVARVIRTHFDKYGKTCVVVKNVEESLTDAQRGLYWVWTGIIGADLGNTKDEQHEYFKERYLLNIFINDPENHPEFSGVVDNMKIIKERCPEQYAANRALVMAGVSTMDATKGNMSELLKEVETMARNNSIRLPPPPRDGLLPDWEK